MWPSCTLAAILRRPYCTSVNSYSPMGLDSRKWDAIDWPCVLWPSHSKWPSEQISFITTVHLPILQLSCRLFWQSITSPRSVSPPLQPRFGSMRLPAFPKAKIADETEVVLWMWRSQSTQGQSTSGTSSPKSFTFTYCLPLKGTENIWDQHAPSVCVCLYFI
jgi:hypothetical protein